MIDLIELRNEIKKGTFTIYIRKDKVYLKDAENGETIVVCDLKELEKAGEYT